MGGRAFENLSAPSLSEKENHMADLFSKEQALISFQAERFSPRGEVCGLAYCFVEACRQSRLPGASRHDARMPDAEFTFSMLDDLDIQALVVRNIDIAREAEEINFQQLEGEPEGTGAVILFEGGTALFFQGGALSESEIDLGEVAKDFPVMFDRHCGLEVIHASLGFRRAHGDVEAWAANLPEELEEDLYGDLQTVLLVEIGDLIDPPSDGVDMSDQMNWSSQDIQALQQTLALAWMAMRTRAGVSIEIQSACDDTDAEIEMTLFGEPDCKDADNTDLIKSYEDLVRGLVDLNSFEGTSWEYNDGPTDRMSGYSQYTIELLSCEIDPLSSRLSSHQILSARPEIERLLADRGWAPQRIQDLFRHIDSIRAT